MPKLVHDKGKIKAQFYQREVTGDEILEDAIKSIQLVDSPAYTRRKASAIEGILDRFPVTKLVDVSTSLHKACEKREGVNPGVYLDAIIFRNFKEDDLRKVGLSPDLIARIKKHGSDQEIRKKAPKELIPHFEVEVSLTPEQKEGQRINKKVLAARSASIGIQERLGGLRHNEMSGNEGKTLEEEGFLLRSGDDVRPDPEKLSKLSLMDKGRLNRHGLHPSRIKQLIERERSKEFFAASFTDWEEYQDPFKMSGFSYCRLDDLSKRYRRELDLIENQFKDARTLDDLKTGAGKLKRDHGIGVTHDGRSRDEYQLSEEELLRKHIGEKKKSIKSNLYWVDKCRSIRSGVDPGIVYGKGLIARLFPASVFREDSPLSNVGLVSGMTGSSVLWHEYRHLDDFVFYGEDRDYRQGELISVGEIYANLADVRSGRRKNWADVGDAVLNAPDYLGQFKEHPAYPGIAKKVTQTLNQLQRLEKIGMSDEVISSILLHSKKYGDITEFWGKLSDDEIRNLIKK